MAEQSEQNPLTFRPPSSCPAKAASPFKPAETEFLSGSWHVTHSTLPMWKKSRNVTITYSPLDDPKGAFDNLVQYQPLKSDKQKSVYGIERPDSSIPSAYNWRGKGLLVVASSHWEVLGYGQEEDGWAVIFFEKTLFTPAGIDIMVRRKGGLSAEMVNRIKREIRKIDDQGFQQQAGKIFEVKHDW